MGEILLLVQLTHDFPWPLLKANTKHTSTHSKAVFLHYFWDVFEIIYILHVPLALPWQLGGWLEEIRVILYHWNKWK